MDLKQLESIIDNDWYYCLAVTVMLVAAFDLGLIIGFIWLAL